MTGKYANTQNLELCQKEEKLLFGFRELSEDDQEELIGLLEMKLRKIQRARSANSKSFNMINEDNMIG